jgi:Ni/Co efflux regulator RcnB
MRIRIRGIGMKKLASLAAAAVAALACGTALAQPAHPPAPPAPGVTWHGPMQHPQMAPHHMMMRAPGAGLRHHLRRGLILPPIFFGPQFEIGNWQLYGFAEPGPDQRWIRYYDDAYLVDGDGRILDEREDMDWGRYGGDWDMEGEMPRHREIIVDARHADGHGHGDERRRVETRVDGGPGYPPPPPPPPGYGYGYGYGAGYYGYGVAYPIVIETVTTSGGGYSEEVTEELVRVRAPRRHVVRRRPRCTCQAPRPRPAPPPPPAGERG